MHTKNGNAAARTEIAQYTAERSGRIQVAALTQKERIGEGCSAFECVFDFLGAVGFDFCRKALRQFECAQTAARLGERCLRAAVDTNGRAAYRAARIVDVAPIEAADFPRTHSRIERD